MRRGVEGEGEKGMKFMPQMSSELWSLIFQMIKVAKYTHKTTIYRLSVIQNWRESWISI